MKKETYTKVHDLLMARMRRELHQKDLLEIKRTSRRLCRLRQRYRKRFAA
ncbi:MAG: hypothetical protein HS115_17810 [Spirochaetales bacterium]|nr:hypothetical protein [Spirochaetales bacterium]MBE7440312.1 hypothetical protein [Spirochaetales bacterium]